MQAMEWFMRCKKVQILFMIHDRRPGENYWYVTDSPGHIRHFETCEEVLRPADPITVSQCKPLIKAICKKHGLQWGRDAKRIIDMCNKAIKDVGYIAQHMATRPGPGEDTSEYLPNLVNYWIPKYIALSIQLN